MDKNEDFCQEGNLSQRLSSPSSHFRTWFIGLEEKRNETQAGTIFWNFSNLTKVKKFLYLFFDIEQATEPEPWIHP